MTGVQTCALPIWAASLAVGSSAVINSPRTGQGSAPIQQDTCRQNTNWPKARKSAIGPFHRSNNQAQPMPQPHIVVADKQQSLCRDSIWRAIPSLREQSKSVIIHTLRTIQTSSTITIMVPTSPNPSISFLLFVQWSISYQCTRRTEGRSGRNSPTPRGHRGC